MTNFCYIIAIYLGVHFYPDTVATISIAVKITLTVNQISSHVCHRCVSAHFITSASIRLLLRRHSRFIFAGDVSMPVSNYAQRSPAIYGPVTLFYLPMNV